MPFSVIEKRAEAITFTPCLQLTFFLQLQIAALGPNLGRGGKEDLEAGIGEYHSAHITAIGDQTGQLPKAVLQGQ